MTKHIISARWNLIRKLQFILFLGSPDLNLVMVITADMFWSPNLINRDGGKIGQDREFSLLFCFSRLATFL